MRKDFPALNLALLLGLFERLAGLPVPPLKDVVDLSRVLRFFKSVKEGAIEGLRVSNFVGA